MARGLDLHQTVAEDGHHARLAAGILPGAVDVAVSQRHVVEAVHLAVVVEIVFAGELRHTVGGHRTLGGAFGRGIHLRLPVDHSPAGHEDHPPGPRAARRLQDVEEAGDVHARVRNRIGYRGADVDLRRVVVDQVEADLADKLPGAGIGDVHLDELGAGGNVRQASRRKVVHHPHPIASLDVGVRYVAPDEAGGAGNQDPPAHEAAR